ncbi:MAG: type I DNA topoisomerase [Thiobacillaceae bacterium]
MSKLVIVESPSKCKTLKKYLGEDFDILASYGHVRDLEPKTGAVDPANHFAMKYRLIERNSKHVEAICKAAKKADEILLATDPDREGEAISWHIAEILGERKLLKTGKLKRIVFYEITQSAVREAVAHPREVSMDLVNAQQARRALDYLVGFNLSPLLWKKISPGLSAGRVQSPALRMIVEREDEIEKFQAREYWTLHLDSHQAKQSFSARLVQFKGEKLQQFSIENETSQSEVLKVLADQPARVLSVEKKRRARHPPPPFTTSTLQQAAVRQLGMTTDRVMRTAQQLYEGIDIGGGAVGLITYMRTDSVNLANEAIADIRAYVGKHFDADYLPSSAQHYQAKTKNAQEAHEAIRPTSVQHRPQSLKDHLSHDQLRLYELIWKRAVASQMTPAQFDTVAADIAVGEGIFRATGQTLAFPGFLAVYQEDEDNEEEARLPPLKEGQDLPVDRLYGEQHFTQPPPRFTEASLVKTLEEYGIGRPSTYASIISTLQDREYVVLDKKRFTPTPIGRLVNCFLTRHFTHYVDYDFTANLEDKLDDVSNGKRVWTRLMGDFWKDFNDTLLQKQDVDRGCPIPDEVCPKCGSPLNMQASKKGLFIGCTAYPKCDYTRPLSGIEEGPTILGLDPQSGQNVLLLNGRYGLYVQIGETPEDKKLKPRRASWPKEVAADQADLATALKLLSLPREVGHHPQTGLPIVANTGRFGPYLLYDGKFKSIPKDDDVYTISLQRAVEVLDMERAPRGSTAGSSDGKTLGKHPDDGKPVQLLNGRYGWYVKHGKVNATVPKSQEPESVTLDEALVLLGAKAAKGPAKKPARKARAA